MLYGRQEIRVPNRLSTLQQIGYAIVCAVFVNACELSVHCVFTHRNLVPFRFSARSIQIAWVLYGQASRAISIG